MTEDATCILKIALVEDLGTAGDITSQAIFNDADIGTAAIRAKQSGVMSGATLITPLYELVDTRVGVETCCIDGAPLEPGTVIANIHGPVRAILAGERTILNLLQRLCGIATLTAKMADALKDTKTKLLDTRKTTPGIRALEKAAVRHGGGVNHRAGLYDMILIKDTHVKRAGGVRAAVAKAMGWRGDRDTPLIEVEVQSIEEFMEALQLRPDRIMLDNMSTQEIACCVDERNASWLNVELEASGSISFESLRAVAATGVDFISSGAVTHSAPALDINLVMT